MSYERFAYAYDRLMREMPYSDWLRFAGEAWNQYGLKPRTIVDLGCGTGNIAIPLGLAGFDVTGIDLSEDMLAVARQKAEQRSLLKGGLLTWVHQDIREWQLVERVDAVISFCDCLNYLLEETDIVQAFQHTYRGLKPGGLFLFDVHTPKQLQNYADDQPFCLNEEDIAYIWTSEYDEKRMEIDHALTIFVQDEEKKDSFQRIEEHHSQRAYPLKWLEQQLLAAGFSEVRQAADFRWQLPIPSTERAFFAALK
ncbi:class I SAM-dependent methyltransferase [Paenibacillus sp. GP183]|jgi:SAM-dependent methyltransferase|uniref:class I SAM-dependent DNA methyltransferase n=1 Tax=Paenibacillus sp. GP183 TaxID=1882751 RepID=UPI00089865E3|nr:class I SAM-dependent methyltransferase [Paenibacillus sp. GP183]SEB40452.1 Methyltransferase domain-containing protein [Paenibacillus sp. GP183]